MAKKRGDELVVTSSFSGQSYFIEEKIGEGGFGVAYRARLGRSGPECCLKASTDQTSWHREAYLGELLRGHERVIQVRETFPFETGVDAMAYAVVMELADGTLEEEIDARGAWEERRAIREIRGLLTAVDRLHCSGALHRDITPMNVFMCGGRVKLGDFGICRHSFGKGVDADCFNPWFVDPKIHEGSRSRWTTGDDMWQVCQLLVCMLTGEVEPISRSEIRGLECSDHLKRVLGRALGDPADQFTDARAMSAALAPTELPFARISSLRGRIVTFTGPMAITRERARRLAERAGARVVRHISREVDVVVVGSQSPHWIAGKEGGTKLLSVAALTERGHGIKLVRESLFMRLVDG
jgi:eukaryotic-like serine/threonine-protein kinase